jgi:ribonuclease HII
MLKSFFREGIIEAGCDEAGRGCLAGPVFAATVILPAGFTHPLLNDSKKLSPGIRYQLRKEIQSSAIDWAVAEVDNEIIDRINILRASIMAMHHAIEKLNLLPEFLIIDGNRFIPYKKIPYKCIIRGDSSYFSIAAASVLAKTYRDDYMKQIHLEHPDYQWDKNKGYPTPGHRRAIHELGITPYHRKTFIHPDKQLTMRL